MFENTSESVRVPFLNWMHGIITDTYLDNIVKFDQIGNKRAIVQGRYDAGSIVSNTDVNAINKTKVDYSIAVYPNPVTDILYVSTVTSAEYFIYNSVGQIVLKGQLQREISILNVEILPSGIYYLRVDRQTVKFVKR